MMADGGERRTSSRTTWSPAGGQTWAMTWFSDDRSIIRHNTFADGKCDFGQRCGIINVGAKSVDPPGRGTVIRDNVLGGISNGGGDQDSRFVADHNLTAVTIPGNGQHHGAAHLRRAGRWLPGPSRWPAARWAWAMRPTGRTWVSSAAPSPGSGNKEETDRVEIR